MLLHRPLKCGTYFTHIQFIDLSSYPLCRSLDSLSNDGNMLLGVTRVLAMEDLEFPILLNKSIGEGSIVVECGPGGSVEHECGLCCGYVLWSETMW